MNTDVSELWSDAIGAAGTVITYSAAGGGGRPVLVFPSEQGRAWDFANNGMIASIAHLVDSGRLRVHCVDSYDEQSWSNASLALEERARKHTQYESWIIDQVVPWTARYADHSAGDPAIGVRGVPGQQSAPQDSTAGLVALGCSLGAFHAANFALKRADLFPLAMCFSGNYDPASWDGWGERGDAAYFNNPLDYVGHLHGDHLDWLRDRVSVLLVCGQGPWEDTTGALPSTRRLAELLAAKGIRHELDLWGHDVAHDWSSWRAQLAHHMPRFC